MKYAVYCVIGALIVWSVFFLARGIYQMVRGSRSCGGGCDGCSCNCPSRKKKRHPKPPFKKNQDGRRR